MGYHRAGFDVFGVDVKPMKRFPFEFVQADAMTYPLDGFDVIHASPPCQAYSITRHSHGKEHPELVEPIRAALKASGKPYVIENVVGAPLHNPITLCGTMFGLTARDTDATALFLRRHRLFESSEFITPNGACRCAEFKAAGWGVGGVYGGGSSDRNHAREVRRGGYTPHNTVRRELMGIDWMTQDQLSQAIPPAYTEHIGAQLLAHVLAGAS